LYILRITHYILYEKNHYLHRNEEDDQTNKINGAIRLTLFYWLRKQIWETRKKIRGYPFAKNSDVIPLIKRRIPKGSRTVLDLGCGMLQDGNTKKEDILLSLFDGYEITGIDVFPKCVDWRRENGPNGMYLNMDFRNVEQLEKTFDVIVSNHSIEHISKKDGERLLDKLENMCTGVLLVCSPIGWVETDYNVKLHNNPYEKHQCYWMPEDFEKKGYEVIKIKNAFLATKKIEPTVINKIR